MGSSGSQSQQVYSGWSCNGNACDNATAQVPLNDYVFVRVRNIAGGYVNFGVNFGSSYVSSNDMYFPPTESRRCGSNWANFSSNTCTFYVFPP